MSEAKLVFSRRRLHKLLGIRDDITITGMYVTDDPQYLCVLLRGEGLPEQDFTFPQDECEHVIVPLNEVQ